MIASKYFQPFVGFNGQRSPAIQNTAQSNFGSMPAFPILLT